MKTILTFCCAALSASALLAADPAVVAQPDLKSPLPTEWAVQKGTFDVKDGEITAAQIPEQKHAAVLWHQVPLQAGAVDLEFKFDGGNSIILGCDGDRHVGRVSVTAKGIQISDDSTEVKGKSPATKLAEAKLDLKQGEWYPLHYEWSGEHMAAKIGELASIQADNPNLAKKKARWWIAVGGATVKIRSIKVTEPRP